MKRLLFILSFTLLFANAYCQNESIKKTWIGSHMEYLKIEDTSAIFYGNGENGGAAFDYTIHKDTITLLRHVQPRLGSSSPPFSYPFKIYKQTDDSLVLEIASQASKLLVHQVGVKGVLTHEPLLVFIDSAKINDVNFTFQKLYVRTPPGGMIAPSVRPLFTTKLEIDSDGNIFYFGIINSNKPAQPTLYKGQLSQADMDSLLYIMKHTALDDLPDFLGHASDCPGEYFTFSYDHKQKKTWGCGHPLAFRRLIYFLYSSPQKGNLIPYSGEHDFDQVK